MQTYTPPGSPARPLAAGITHWTTANTIPAGSQNAPPSLPRTRPVKKSRFTKVRNFLRRDSTPNAPMPTSAIRPQIAEHPNINLTSRRPTPLRPTVRRPQTAHTTSITSNQPFKIPRKPLPPGALSRSQWMALANSASTQVPNQPHVAPMSSAPVSPISTSAMGAQYDSRPVSPMFPTSPASSTASEPDFNQARINRMSTYSYLDGTDLSSYAFSPCADKFAISRSASPVALTRASSSAVNTSARGQYVLRTATPVAFQKARAVNVPGPVRNPSAASSPRSRLRLALTSEITPRSVYPGVLRETRHQPTIVQPSRVQSSSASLYFGITPETFLLSDSSSSGSETASLHYVIGCESSSSGPSTDSDSSSDDGSIGSHAKILKKALTKSLDKNSLIKKPFVKK
ncbi:hypothetical protein D6D01_09881 [Aureobasidium pullulans]|uniref:Uncharacterized protein n=1 Tax=Aureobasidium pullulans TaxID=5580 RepID=A0A4S9JXD4_AURPU|nr:hypothetical protein D6D01_09881 [Aureobasidium pullulans]